MGHREIGTTIRQRRLLLGLTQERVASLAGVGRRTVSDLETSRGNRGTTLSKAVDVCNVLGLELFVGDADRESGNA